MRKLKAALICWLLEQLGAVQEDALLAPLEGAIPASDAHPAVKLDYWLAMQKSLTGEDGTRIMYRVQLMYNALQLELLQCDPLQKEKMSVIGAKMQALYTVLRLPQKAAQMAQAIASRVKDTQEIAED